jgi:hypothetical protein
MKPEHSMDRRTRAAAWIAVASLAAISTVAAQTLPPLPELPEISPPGPAFPQKAPGAPGGIEDPRVGTLEDGRKLEEAVREMIRAYETGNLALVESRIDPAMIGYQRFVEGLRRDINQMQQIRIQLTDTQVTVGPDVGVVRTRFEKRFVNATDFRPGLVSGQTQMLFHRRGDFWNVSGFSGDNLFASSSGSLAQAIVTPGTLFYGGSLTTTLQITEPDAVGQPALLVSVTTSSGDQETLAIPAVRPGVFSRSITISALPATPGDGVVQEETRPIGNVVIRYTDPTPGDNRPPVVMVQTIRLQ